MTYGRHGLRSVPGNGLVTHDFGVTLATDPPPLRILVVDPDDRTRESLCGILGIGSRCAVVGHAGDASEALRLVGELAPDMLVIDANVEDAGQAQSFIDAVRATSPATRIVVMSSTDLAEAGTRCPEVDAVIRKTFRPKELVDALLGVGQRTPGQEGLPC